MSAWAMAAVAAGALLFACVGDSPKLPESQCDGTDTFCGSACTNTQTDPRNCGACSKQCNIQAGEVCQKGACGPSCTGGTTRCGNSCLDVQNDPQNCGDCAKKCGAAESCVMGKCTLVCRMGLQACPRGMAPPPMDGGMPEGGSPDAGPPSGVVCTDVSSDPLNCGKCGTVCPPDKSTCDAGQCKIGKFNGVLTNVAQDDLASAWKECFAEPYNGTTTTVSSLTSSKCSQANWLVGCRQTGVKTLITAAQAPRTEVLLDVGVANYTFHVANGVQWYYSAAGGAALGYTALGDVLNKSNCDTAGGLAPEKRLCWHASAGTFYGGYRCGTQLGLNSSTAYERVIFQSP